MTKHPTLRIIAKHTFTLFNLVNVILAGMVLFVGSYKNILFILIALANTLIGIINDLRAQKIVNQLKLLSEKRPVVIRDGHPVEVPASEVQKGDIVRLALGDQIMFDSVLMSGTCEVNESFITGEQENIVKNIGDDLISGSFVTSGAVTAKVVHTADENFVSKLQAEASTIKTADSKLFTLMNKIVRYISYALIPIGALLLWSRFRAEADTATAITSTVAALINMIPEGLILLTSTVLALATIRLSRQKVLVQDLYAIETLARVDCVALDKTGTLTSGNMTVEDILLPDFTPADFSHPTTTAEKRLLGALQAILSHQAVKNATITAIDKKLLKTGKFSEIKGITEVIDFSSDRKYSGIKTKNTTYLMGAIDFITEDKSLIRQVHAVSGTCRTLAIMMYSNPKKTGDPEKSSSHEKDGSPKPPELLGLVRLSDEIRPTAPKIIKYFYDNNIAVKIISGDDLAAVTDIAQKVGVTDLRGIDLSAIKTKDYKKLVQDYAIFTRVTPSEKKSLIKAMRATGQTVAMTGDGVNDILAMKEADVAIAIGAGADAARRTAQFVLLDSDYDAVPAIVDEGRQSINNLERSASLFLNKTTYASLLAVLFVILPFGYPYTPIEMTLLNFACIGFPGVILALEHNTARIKNQFVNNIKRYSIPTGITIAVTMLVLSIIATNLNVPKPLLTTLSCAITAAIDASLIYRISRPLNRFRAILLVAIILIVALALILPFTRVFFEFA